ncbi:MULTISPECIES: hypothetical protein [unclassified Wolbachia]|uniref:hypothetical protein n=1 Tax=unclassified Wolbachia TaxID=2640676 RepID=UPI0021F8CB0E|nr:MULTISPECIES: hypothetical protein [unclassified Wolbachia]
MLKYEDLSPEQQKLFRDLEKALKDKSVREEDISQIFEVAKTEDIFAVFQLHRDEERDEDSHWISVSFLRNLISHEHCRLVIFDMVQKKDLLERFLNIDFGVKHVNDFVDEEYRVADIIVKCNDGVALAFDEITRIFGFENFWKALSEVDRNMIKDTLQREMLEDGQDKSKYEGFLKKIEAIEDRTKQSGNPLGTSSSQDIGNESKSSKNDQSEVDKAIVAGAICGVMTGLAVGGGLFAAGASLPILALIGIAVAAAVLTGLIAGGITYEMSKPSENLNNVDLLSEQIYLSLGV